MIIGHQHIVRSTIADLEHQFGVERALPATLALLEAYERIGELYAESGAVPAQTAGEA